MILLAEDEDAHRFLFNKAVKHLSIAVRLVTVNDGAALMRFINNRSNPQPDLIFLDINMPYKNGLECLKEIREIERYYETPVVIYSTSDEGSDRRAALENKATLFLYKDGDVRSLSRILLLLLSGQQIPDPCGIIKSVF